MVRSFACACALTAAWMLVPSLASANTYIVDAAGGGAFTDIGAAVAATQPGDVLLVMPGQYSGFVLDKGLILVGYGNVAVNGTVTIHNVPLGPRAAIVHLSPHTIAVDQCFAPVVLQELPSLTSISVAQSNDVRCRNIAVDAGHGQQESFTIAGSRVEIANASCHGRVGNDPGVPTNLGSGGSGLICQPGSRVHVTSSNVLGGDGAYTQTNFVPAGDGAYAVHMVEPSELYLMGPGTQLWGGVGGWATWTFSCDHDGRSGGGIDAQYHPAPMSVVHRSGTIIHAQGYNISYDCLTGSVAPDTLWVVDNLVNPDDPSLDVAGSLVAGTTITFTVHAQPGSHAVLRMGRGLALVPTPGIDIEQLVQANRNFDLGIVPTSGQATKVIPLPATFTPGLFFAAQAEVTGTNGLRRTNSVPVIVR